MRRIVGDDGDSVVIMTNELTVFQIGFSQNEK